jgi:hypothetical protein
MAGCLGLYRSHVVAIGEACLAILGWYGRESVGWVVRVIKCGVLPRGLGVQGHNVCVLPGGLGGLVDRKSKAPRALQGFKHGLWALGGRG